MELKISVIIPINSVRNKIYKCLESIKNQTFKDFEVIFIDDGSRDDSIYFARDFLKYSGISYRIIKNRNEGISSSRNLGIDEANGEYILFLDCENYININLLDDLRKIVDENDCDIVYSGYICEDSDGHKKYSNISKLKEGEYSGKDTAREVIYGFKQPSLSSNLFSKDLIVKNNLKFDSNRMFEAESAFLIKAYAHAEKIYCSKKISSYYVTWDEAEKKKNISKNYLDKYYSNVETLEYLKEKIEDDQLVAGMKEYRIPLFIIDIFSEFAGKGVLDQVLDNFLLESDVKNYLKELKVHKLEKKRIQTYILGKTIMKTPQKAKAYFIKLRKEK